MDKGQLDDVIILYQSGQHRNFMVAILTRNYPRPSETFILRQAQYLKADIVYRAPGTERRTDLYKGCAHCLCGDSAYEKAYNIWHKLVSKMRGNHNYDWNVRTTRNMKSYLKKREIKVVLAQLGPNGIASVRACREAGVRHVTHFHGYDLSSALRNPGYVKDLRKLAKLGDAFVVVNRQMIDILLDLGYERRQIHHLPCGVDLNSFPDHHVVRANRHHEAVCSFVFVGRFVAKKNPLGLLRAFAQTVIRAPNSRLVLVGGGKLMEDVKAEVTNLELVDKVTVLDSAPPEFIKKVMYEADVYVQHSMTDNKGNREGWPISIAEAAASGLPIISTRHAGILDQVIDGKTGFLVDEGDYIDMGQKMAELALNSNIRINFGAAGRKHITAVGDFATQAAKLKNILLPNG